MKKYYLILLVIVALLFLPSCGQNQPLKESQLVDSFSEEFLSEITHYSVNGVDEQFLIDDVVLERRQTREKTDVSICTIKLQHESYSCEINAALTYEYYDQGGWFLENWDIRQTTIRPLNGIPDSEIYTIESAIQNYYPDAILLSRETSLEADIPTDVFTYEIPIYSIEIESSGPKITEGGTIQVSYRFEDYGYGYYWNSEWNLDAFYRNWSHYQGTWNNGGPKTSGAGSVYYLVLNDILLDRFDVDTLDVTIRYQPMGSETSHRAAITLYKCVPGTTAENVVSENDCFNCWSLDFSVECLFFGFVNYPKYLSEPQGEQYAGCIMLTRDGLYFFEEGKTAVGEDGNAYIRYYSVDPYFKW